MTKRKAESILTLIEQYQRQLQAQEEVKVWLKKKRGLSDEVIFKFKLGWTGRALAIPIYDKDGNYIFFRYRADPIIESPDSKYWCDKGASAGIYGLEHIIDPKPVLVLCAGELDRLILEAHGLAAITFTSGEGTFNEEWAEILNGLNSEILICYDNDGAGLSGAVKVSGFLPRAKIVTIPKIEGIKDTTDFIVANGIDEFKKLLAEAKEAQKLEGHTAVATDGYSIVGKVTRAQLALDFTQELAIVTLPFPTKFKVKGVETTQDRYWMVTSDKKLRLLEDVLLSELGLYTSSGCFIMDNRWDYDHIKAWMRGKVVSNPKTLFEMVKGAFTKYLDYTDKRLYVVVTLWLLGTYVFPLFNSYPILIMVGTSGSGKSKTIKIIELIGFNSINSANMSDASLFRLVEGGQATLLLDENEMINDPQRAAQLSLILSAFNKQGRVVRVEKSKDGEFIPKLFSLFGPKAMANIIGINSEALINRSILIHTIPTQVKEIANIYPRDTDPEWQKIRNEAYLFVMEHWKHIRDLMSAVTAHELGLTGYDFMIWQPILILAKYFEPFVGVPLLEDVVSLAKEKTQERKRDRASGRMYVLLASIRKMVAEKISIGAVRDDGAEFYPTRDILKIYASELEIDEFSDAFRKLSVDSVGKQVKNLGVGEMGLVRTEIENKLLRGVWIKLDNFNERLAKYEIEPVLRESRPEKGVGVNDMETIYMHNLDKL